MDTTKVTNLELNGVLIGNDETGYTAYFVELPEVISEGETKEEAKIQLNSMLQFWFETKKEIFESEKAITDLVGYNTFTTELTIA